MSLTIDTQPANQKAVINGSLNLSVQASGTAPLHYAWKHDGTTIGADSSTYQNLAFLTVDRGLYRVAVSNVDGTVVSNDATVTVQPIITAQPVSQAFMVKSAASLPVSVLGYSPTYQWLKNDATIYGATANPLNLAPYVDSSKGVYKVIVYDDGNDTTSTDATVTTGQASIPMGPPPIRTGLLDNGTLTQPWQKYFSNEYNFIRSIQNDSTSMGGLKGATGVQGPQGYPGIQGPSGAQGIPGVEGQTGVQGLQGLAGATGVPGPGAGVSGVANYVPKFFDTTSFVNSPISCVDGTCNVQTPTGDTVSWKVTSTDGTKWAQLQAYSGNYGDGWVMRQYGDSWSSSDTFGPNISVAKRRACLLYTDSPRVLLHSHDADWIFATRDLECARFSNVGFKFGVSMDGPRGRIDFHGDTSSDCQLGIYNQVGNVSGNADFTRTTSYAAYMCQDSGYLTADSTMTVSSETDFAVPTSGTIELWSAGANYARVYWTDSTMIMFESVGAVSITDESAKWCINKVGYGSGHSTQIKIINRTNAFANNTLTYKLTCCKSQ